MEEGIFPSQQNFGEPSELSEERRLAYVAITRAKEKLYITHSNERMMYGKTTINRLSRFAKLEIPYRLIKEERDRSAPPRMSAYQSSYGRGGDSYKKGYDLSELRRESDILPRQEAKTRKMGASEYGVERFSVGTRVNHATFGNGVIASARDMGGDVLYEVNFEAIGTKKLMATYAKLRKI
jgi:DNA helicase-2/ATP-dependent DNA helicase PcrA